MDKTRKRLIEITRERAQLIRQLAQPEIEAAVEELALISAPNSDLLELIEKIYAANPQVGIALIRKLAPYDMRFNEAVVGRALTEAIAECS